MFRDMILSSVGHTVVFIVIVVASLFNRKPEIESFDVYQVKTVTPQSISELIRRNETVEKPVPTTPQIKTETKALPTKHRKEAQPVKRSDPKSTTVTETKTTSKTTGVQGLRVDSEIDIEYLLELRNRIERNWRPINTGKTLATRVYFRIGTDGKIQRVYIEKPTGNINFDRSAFDAVRLSDPFPPLPDDFENDTLGVHFDFIYEVD